MSALTTNDFMKMGFAQACMKAADIAYELEQLRAEIEALKQQVEQGKRDAIPEGFVLVPKEPNFDMLEAGYDELGKGEWVLSIYKAMIAAAQKPTHVLWATGEPGAPEAILDRNGEVALRLCKVCGRGECELDESCVPKEKS